jgi:5-methylcytosine-specific restriction endonuclease McrA
VTLRPCIDCGTLTTASRCAAHARTSTRDRSSEPWRILYSTSSWRRVRIQVRNRDGGCVRCGAKYGLTVHHMTPLREAWSIAASYNDFLRIATDPAGLVTLCPRCHRHLENLVPQFGTE